MTIRFHNIRYIHDLEIDLDKPLNLFIGPNGSGKSTVFKYLVLFQEFFELKEAFFLDLRKMPKSRNFFNSTNEILLSSIEEPWGFDLVLDGNVKIVVRFSNYQYSTYEIALESYSYYFNNEYSYREETDEEWVQSITAQFQSEQSILASYPNIEEIEDREIPSAVPPIAITISFSGLGIYALLENMRRKWSKTGAGRTTGTPHDIDNKTYTIYKATFFVTRNHNFASFGDSKPIIQEFTYSFESIDFEINSFIFSQLYTDQKRQLLIDDTYNILDADNHSVSIECFTFPEEDKIKHLHISQVLVDLSKSKNSKEHQKKDHFIDICTFDNSLNVLGKKIKSLNLFSLLDFYSFQRSRSLINAHSEWKSNKWQRQIFYPEHHYFINMRRVVSSNEIGFELLNETFIQISGRHDFKVRLTQAIIRLGIAQDIVVDVNSRDNYAYSLRLLKNDTWVSFNSLSKGERSMTLLLMYIHSITKGVVIVEEPDTHLHPNMQSQLIRELLSYVHESEGRISLILETHSIYFLRELQLMVAESNSIVDPQTVIIHYRSKNGNLNQSISILPNGSLSDDIPAGFSDHLNRLDLLRMQFLD